MTKSVPPTLLDPKGMGGIVAQEGFDYQIAIGLIRLPTWLANPAFEQLIFEGLEDVEARFFNPYAPKLHMLERIQAKSGGLTKKAIKAVFTGFKSFHDHHPDIATVHTLATPQLTAGMQWLSRDPKRVRNARPFYAPFGELTRATDIQLKASFQKEFGDVLGEFACCSVEVKPEPATDSEQAAARFASNLTAAFPDTACLPGGALLEVFQTLAGIAGRRRGQPLGRDFLLNEIGAVLGRPLLQDAGFPLHIRSNRQEEAQSNAMEIDASAFSGPGGQYPAEPIWTEQLMQPLQATSAWLRKTGVRDIALAGGYRTTTAMVIGWSFRSAAGFEISVPTKVGPWRTDARGAPSLVDLAVEQPTQLADGVLHVCVGILRDPATDLQQSGVLTEQILRLHLDRPVDSPESMQALVGHLKLAVNTATGKLRPNAIHLYFAGPAALAVAIGHRWNAMPPTYLHEFDVLGKRYQPTAVLREHP